MVGAAVYWFLLQEEQSGRPPVIIRKRRSVQEDGGASSNRDNYQVRIKIESAFGMFTEQWALLRSITKQLVWYKHFQNYTIL
jgi:hypothetical protein